MLIFHVFELFGTSEHAFGPAKSSKNSMFASSLLRTVWHAFWSIVGPREPQKHKCRCRGVSIFIKSKILEHFSSGVDVWCILDLFLCRLAPFRLHGATLSRFGTFFVNAEKSSILEIFAERSILVEFVTCLKSSNSFFKSSLSLAAFPMSTIIKRCEDTLDCDSALQHYAPIANQTPVETRD